MDWDYSDPSFVDNGYAALIVDSGYNFDFDPSRNFSQLADGGILGNTNYGSYSNPDVESLLEQVRQNPTCSVPERADLLQQVDRLFQEDPPALWLFTVNEYMVTRGITGIQPSAYNPLWNLPDWTVRP
jgi:ABC-type transport system substrate-binding protein